VIKEKKFKEERVTVSMDNLGEGRELFLYLLYLISALSQCFSNVHLTPKVLICEV